MLPMFACLAALLVADPAADLAPAWQLSYRGHLARVLEDQSLGEPEKRFDVLYFIDEGPGGQPLVRWYVDEAGRGSWPWIDRVGNATFAQLAELHGPNLRFDRGDASGTIPLTGPQVTAEIPAEATEELAIEGGRYELVGQTTFADRPAWELRGHTGPGRKRRWWRDQERPLLLGYEEQVFQGQGEEYLLSVQLVVARQLDSADQARLHDAFAALDELRLAVGRTEPSLAADWNEEQRADGVAELVRQFEGAAVEQFAADRFEGGQLTLDDLADHVTVLHFWDYRDEPLKEPYGQVGYLDFLHGRRSGQGVQVFGVAVSGRLAEPDQRGAAIRSVRKLKEFMNLGYPLLLDGGALLKQFGDPRVAGAALPLYVVIGPDRKIVHYHVGLYEVDQNQGLVELDAVVGQAAAAKN